ncbi:MAG TPA: glycosyltransferase family 1 protein [Thermomicrobiaceae bacterium]|nr:glycosyltransferase family 1 protein [Thermomicrobiaceae bacterium]
MRVGILGHLLSFASDYRQAGVSRYIEFLARNLPQVAPGDEFLLFTGPTGARGAPQLPQGVHVLPGRLPTGRPELRILWEQVVAPPALARYRMDVVHAPVNVAPVLSPVPTVVTVHDLAFARYPEQYPGLKQRYLNALTRRSVRRASRVIAVSENTRIDVLRDYGVAPERVVTVPNGIDPAMKPVPDDDALARFRGEHGLPRHFLLFVGTLQPRKNLLGLLRAYARVRDRLDLPLVVVGGAGWHYTPIFDEVQRLGLNDRVSFAGYAAGDTLASWYSAATAFVFPSLYEGFGLPVAEAMACGTAVVTSSTSSLPEVAGDAALLVDPRDLEALGEALVRVASDEALRRNLRERGLARARQFTWERTARETVAVYHEAARTGRQARRASVAGERS